MRLAELPNFNSQILPDSCVAACVCQYLRMLDDCGLCSKDWALIELMLYRTIADHKSSLADPKKIHDTFTAIGLEVQFLVQDGGNSMTADVCEGYHEMKLPYSKLDLSGFEMGGAYILFSVYKDELNGIHAVWAMRTEDGVAYFDPAEPKHGWRLFNESGELEDSDLLFVGIAMRVSTHRPVLEIINVIRPVEMLDLTKKVTGTSVDMLVDFAITNMLSQSVDLASVTLYTWYQRKDCAGECTAWREAFSIYSAAEMCHMLFSLCDHGVIKAWFDLLFEEGGSSLFSKTPALITFMLYEAANSKSFQGLKDELDQRFSSDHRLKEKVLADDKGLAQMSKKTAQTLISQLKHLRLGVYERSPRSVGRYRCGMFGILETLRSFSDDVGSVSVDTESDSFSVAHLDI